MKVSIHHIIDNTSKEIYDFEKIGDTWNYVGCYYSNRNDENDTWGDEWDSSNSFKSLDKFAKSKGFEDYDDLESGCHYYNYIDELEAIKKRYNPCCNKTTSGKTYYSGCHWGYGNRGDKYTPKMSISEIEAAILKQVSKIKVKL